MTLTIRRLFIVGDIEYAQGNIIPLWTLGLNY